MTIDVQPTPLKPQSKAGQGRFWRELALSVGAISSRAVWFTFVHALMFLAFYLLGNFQQFLDSSQLVLLRLFEVAAAFTGAFGAYAVIYLIARTLAGSRLPVTRLVATASATVVSVALVLLFKLSQAWFRL